MKVFAKLHFSDVSLSQRTSFIELDWALLCVLLWAQEKRHSFLPRAMLTGPKRSFVVVVLGGVESWAKNVPNGIKNVPNGIKNVPNGTKIGREQKMLYMEQKMVVNKKMLQMEQKTCYGAKNNPRSQNEVHKRPSQCYLLWHIMVFNCRVCLVWH